MRIDVPQPPGLHCVARFFLTAVFAACLFAGYSPGAALAQAAVSGEATALKSAASDGKMQSAPVIIDGNELFSVVGVAAFPAEKRASLIAEKISAVADDPDFSVEQLRAEEVPNATAIFAGKTNLFYVFDADGRIAGLERQVLVYAYLERIKEAIADYRSERSTGYLLERGLHTLIATAVLAFLLFITHRLMRFFGGWIKAKYRPTLESARVKATFGTVSSRQFWTLLEGAQRGIWWLIVFVASYAYVERTLSLFPWTRRLAHTLLTLVLYPLEAMATAVANSVPNIAFLIMLFFIVRYLLQWLGLFFFSVGRGAIRITDFEPEWAIPVYELVRVLIVGFTLVVAYPYIPGSSTEAFKGVSVFIGILISIGSSSLLANWLAGYGLIWRRAFKLGDRVLIGEHTGDIVEMGQTSARLLTLKNEEVIIPNSAILNANVVNYSTMAREKRLILHSTVTIGYDAPWRQIEALLLLAVERTAGLLQEPCPFVLKPALNDFYVTYEVNAYCDDASRIAALYSDLHQNILDVFNEHGVQIMSPHFISQPEQAVVVPKDRWFQPPARRQDSNQPGAARPDGA